MQHGLWAQQPPPNVLVILVDDMGFSDIGCYGGEIPTPEIDALARDGVRFSQFYNTGRCCPTRASLLTGRYPHQVGVGHMVNDRGQPGFRGHLDPTYPTIADTMSQAGYFTAVAGKWHVGHQERAWWPLQRGFDRFYGVPQGGGFYYKAKRGRDVVSNNDVLYSVDQQPPDDWYSTDAWTLASIRFIDECLQSGKPFFLYLAHNAPHFPLQAPERDIARFRGKFRAGWDKLREERYARQLKLGLIREEWPLSPRPDQIQAWDTLTEKQKTQYDDMMAIYAAVMSRLDRSIGILVDALRERDMLHNTMILFLSDNGGCAEGGNYGKYVGDHPGDADSNVFCGKAWATLQNTPFRLYKHFNHEGGVSTPLIVHWPAGVAADQRGKWYQEPGHVIDIMPTCLDAAKAPATLRQGLSGTSLLPAVRGESLRRDKPLFWEHEGNRAVRDGDWKLVAQGPRGPWELYNLVADRTELNDLADRYPERVHEMRLLWEQWAQANQVLPWIWKPPYSEESR